MAKRKCNYDDPLDVLTNQIEQGFMQGGGWRNCRYLLGKLVDDERNIQGQLREQIRELKEELRERDSRPMWPDTRGGV